MPPYESQEAQEPRKVIALFTSKGRKRPLSHLMHSGGSCSLLVEEKSAFLFYASLQLVG
jgi:hypothetical protein